MKYILLVLLVIGVGITVGFNLSKVELGNTLVWSPLRDVGLQSGGFSPYNSENEQANFEPSFKGLEISYDRKPNPKTRSKIKNIINQNRLTIHDNPWTEQIGDDHHQLYHPDCCPAELSTSWGCQCINSDLDSD